MKSHPPSLRDDVLAMLAGGASQAAASEHFGVPRGTIGWWAHEDRRRRGVTVTRRSYACPRCEDVPLDRAAYSYLLGLYLGDGHIVSKAGQHHLTISCCDAFPGLIDEAEEAMRAVMPGKGVRRVQKKGCTDVKSYTSQWTCPFPQHGPGRKHDRPIVLEPWQQEIVDAHPWELVRGLFHSDGCRSTNWTVRTLAGGPKRYEYPRWFFTNASEDIVALCTRTLDRLGVVWRRAGTRNVSVARRESVALMDLRVGPKH